MLLNCFIIFLSCAYCFSKRFTSCTLVPLPRAMRWRREPLITSGLCRSPGVIDEMIASKRPRSACSALNSSGAPLSILPNGSIPMIWSSGPIWRS